MTIRRQPEGQHVVAIPYPAQGHINPMLLLCQNLLPLGFTFTFINTHHIHRRLQRPFSLGMEGRGDPIDMVFVEGGVPPEDHAHDGTIMRALNAANDMKEAVEQLVTKLVDERRVAFILTDIFLGWGSEMAIKFRLPWVCFCPASTASLAACVHLADLAKQGKCVPLPEDEKGDLCDVLEGIPGLPVTRLGDVIKMWDNTGHLNYERLKKFHASQKARFVLINTFEELEGGVLEALSERQYRTLALGPLLPLSRASSVIHMDADRAVSLEGCVNEAFMMKASLFEENRTCLDWLDKQPPASVLFISFGSISVRSEEQSAELAHAVEATGCPYLWVRKPDISTAHQQAVEPEHRGHGLIVPWVPQLEVLSHPATGGFLTHCGWNSVMEAVAMGVPMLCWADMGERMSNQRFVVRVWKCGLEMVEDGRRYKQHVDEAVVVRRGEIEKAIRRLMVEEAGASVRAQSVHLRDAAAVALRETRSRLNTFADSMLKHSL